MEVVQLGRTDLPLEVILEYLESLKQIYTPESYDLFAHNCNNFTNDFAMFLVGNGIPKHITSLPETVLNTPFGMMLRPQLDREMRSITQAAVPPQAVPPRPTAASTASTSKLAEVPQGRQSSGRPSHAHDQLKLPLFKKTSMQPVTYKKVPPLGKLVAKMGASGNDSAVRSAVEFIRIRDDQGAQEAPLPDMPTLGKFFRDSTTVLPADVLFSSYDLLRLLVADPRASGYFAGEQDCVTFLAMLGYVNGLQDCPYNLKLVAIHMCCNMFNSPVFEHLLLSDEEVMSALTKLVTNNLLDRHHNNVRVSATSLAHNVATTVCKRRTSAETQGSDDKSLVDGPLVELAAALLEALSAEQESAEAIRGIALSLARLAYRAAPDCEILDLYRAMDASSVLLEKVNVANADDRGLINEIAKELLSKGLQ